MVAYSGTLGVENMTRLFAIVTVGVLAALSSQAEAFCGDAAASCGQAFSGPSSSLQDGTTPQWQGFSSQTGAQQPGQAMKFGNFSLYSSVSQGPDWNTPRARYGSSLANGAGAQDHGVNCALYGTC